MTLAKATLTELDQAFEENKPGGQQFEVQFNPETLKVTFANEIKQPEGGDQSSGSGGRQFVGKSSTKLSLQLWFDVTAMEKDPVDDVRRLTGKVAFFMKPVPSDKDPKKSVPPGVAFQFGTFIFKGMVEAMEETLEFFSPEGKPLRASVNLTLSQQAILESTLSGTGSVLPRPGHSPLTSAKQNDTVPDLAGKNGKDDWQSIAAANGIEDPLRISPGALIDLNVGAGLGGGTSFGASAGAAFDIGASASVDAGFGFSAGAEASASAAPGLNASLGGSASASLSIG